MAISSSSSILAMLKVYYKDGVENLMFRNSPVLKKIKKERVEGKSQNFSAMYGRGGAVAGDFTAAAGNAAETARAVEFAVTPGQLFSVYTMNSKEVQASQSKKGAYMKTAGAKMFAASEAFRKTLAAALYGSGYGEICTLGTQTATSFTANTAVDIELPEYAIMAIDIGSKLEYKAALAGAKSCTMVVNSINGKTVNVTPDTAIAALSSAAFICIAGSDDASHNPILPVGLAGWLPTARTNLSTAFMGVTRNIAPDRLAGIFYEPSATEAKNVTVQKLLQKCRRQGSQADLIIMNDNDFMAFASEIQANNTYFTQTSTKEKRSANVGFEKFSASFSTNYIENIIDDPYCPEGRFYILDSEYVQLWSYTNADKINDGIEGNNAGKQNPMEMDGEGKAETPFGLIIDDYLNVQSGTSTWEGPALQITLQMFGSFVVTNPSVCGVGKFYGASGIA